MKNNLLTHEWSKIMPMAEVITLIVTLGILLYIVYIFISIYLSSRALSFTKPDYSSCLEVESYLIIEGVHLFPGDKFWIDGDCKVHRENGSPAIIRSSGEEEFYLHGIEVTKE